MITISTPFAGKDYCFKYYARGIKNLDWNKKDIEFVAIDNSNDEKFGLKIDKFAKSVGFKKYRRFVYTKSPKTIETTDDYAKISAHCHNIYQVLEKHLPDNEYTYNIEDDVEVPPDSLKKLIDIHEKYPDVGTAVGSCSSRRMKDRLVGHPVAWRFRQKRVFPYPDMYDNGPVDVIRFQSAPPFGISIIGAAHIGCWLTKTDLIKELSFKDLHGLGANDIAWGWKINMAGYHFVIDWSVKTKHWWKHKGEIGYYD